MSFEVDPLAWNKPLTKEEQRRRKEEIDSLIEEIERKAKKLLA